MRRLVVALLVLIGLSVVVYFAATKTDREIAFLKSEIRKTGLAISDKGRGVTSQAALADLGKQLQMMDKVPFNMMNSNQRIQHMKDTEPIFVQLKDVEFVETQRSGDIVEQMMTDGEDTMYVFRAVRHCSDRVSFFRDSDPQRALEALDLSRRLAEELAERGSPMHITTYARAYASCVEAWVGKPDLIKQLLEAKRPQVDTMVVLRMRLDWDTALLKAGGPFPWSASPTELWSNFKGLGEEKVAQRDYFAQVLEALKTAKSPSAIDLAIAVFNAQPPAARHGLEGQFFLIHGMAQDLNFLASGEVVHRICEAYIEMHRTDPNLSALPKREPFLDPYSGESFLIQRDGEVLLLGSVGPNGSSNAGKEDDIVLKFKPRPSP